MRKAALVVAAVAVAVCSSGAYAQKQEMKHEGQVSKVTGTPQWDTLKSLVGKWEGYTEKDGKKYETRIEIRMTGDGSAVMHWMDQGTPHEMVTMFHMDKEDLVATHYCSAHNQPRFKAEPSKAANQVAFAFMDGTNIRPGDAHMARLVITVLDPDHHDEDWGYEQNGEIHSGTFHLTRVKAATSNP